MQLLQPSRAFFSFGLAAEALSASSSTGRVLSLRLPRSAAASAAASFCRSFGRQPLRSLFAFFKVAEVVAHRNADLLQRLFADARNLLELLGRHVGQRLDRGDAGSDQLLNDAFAQLA